MTTSSIISGPVNVSGCNQWLAATDFAFGTAVNGQQRQSYQGMLRSSPSVLYSPKHPALAGHSRASVIYLIRVMRMAHWS